MQGMVEKIIPLCGRWVDESIIRTDKDDVRANTHMSTVRV